MSRPQRPQPHRGIGVQFGDRLRVDLQDAGGRDVEETSLFRAGTKLPMLRTVNRSPGPAPVMVLGNILESTQLRNKVSGSWASVIVLSCGRRLSAPRRWYSATPASTGPVWRPRGGGADFVDGHRAAVGLVLLDPFVHGVIGRMVEDIDDQFDGHRLLWWQRMKNTGWARQGQEAQ